MGDFVLNVNGAHVRVNASSEETLLSVLRNRLNLTGTKYGCGEGQCGACTVLQDGKLSPVQQAFLDAGAFQCGYCTSGMILSATSLLHERHNPTEEQIVEAMEGNLCRCGTYPRILDAVKRASRSPVQGASR